MDKKEFKQKEKLIGTKTIELIKQKMKPLSKKGEKSIQTELNNYLKEKALGILIISRFDEFGQTKLTMEIMRTHERHILETFEELFKKQPQIKLILKKMFENEENEKNEKIIMSGMVR